MMKIRAVALFFAFLMLLGAGCASKYVGKTISYDSPIVCECVQKPCACHIPREHFDFTFQVEPAGSGEYLLQGEAVNVQSEGADRITKGVFIFLLIKDQVVAHVVSIAPKGSLGTNIPIEKRFEYPHAFDAIAVTYDITVR